MLAGRKGERSRTSAGAIITVSATVCLDCFSFLDRSRCSLLRVLFSALAPSVRDDKRFALASRLRYSLEIIGLALGGSEGRGRAGGKARGISRTSFAKFQIHFEFVSLFSRRRRDHARTLICVWVN